MPSFRLAHGDPQDPSLPNGTQSASMMNALLLGLLFALPEIALPVSRVPASSNVGD